MSVVRKTPTNLEGWKKEYLIEALQEMFGAGMRHCRERRPEGPLFVVKRSGRQLEADVVVRLGNTGDIGFEVNSNTGNFEVVADWYMIGQHQAKLAEAGIEGTDRVSVVSGVLQKTNHAFVKKSLKKKDSRRAH